MEKITSYKGFDANWKCRDFQFEVGQSYEHDGDVESCRSGFHACEHPLNVFEYYPPAGSKFAIVEQSGDLGRHDSDTEVASKRISIMAEISIASLVKAAVEYVSASCHPINPESPASSTDYRGAASSTDYRGAASSTGDCGAASSTGDYGAASSTGDCGAASSTGDYDAASSTGDYGAASSTGYRGAASSTGKQSVAMAVGLDSRAMSSETGAIVLVRRNDDGEIVHIRASKVGENGIKAGVWYALDETGEFVEVGEPA